MSTAQLQSAADHVAQPNTSSTLNDRSNPTKLDSSLQTANLQPSTWVDRLKSYFLTNEGRITLASLICSCICVVLQHAMGTCVHVVSDHKTPVQWHVFTPPFGAGPHTAVFFFVLSWITLVYCIERVWMCITTGARISKKRDLIVRGVIVALYLVAFGFNVWGYVLCESTSQVNEPNQFAPGICRGESQACIPLVAGILAACAAAGAFFSEHILELTTMIKDRRKSSEAPVYRIAP